jgi:hypothetical protein
MQPPRYESYSLRLDELLIKDIKFLHGQDMPTLAVLYEDNKQKRHVKTYVINLKDKELVKGPWSQPNVESGASLLHSLPRMSHFLKSEHVSSTDFLSQVLAEACWFLETRALHISKATPRYMFKLLQKHSEGSCCTRTSASRRSQTPALMSAMQESAVPLSMKPCIINCTAVIEESAECCKCVRVSAVKIIQLNRNPADIL